MDIESKKVFEQACGPRVRAGRLARLHVVRIAMAEQGRSIEEAMQITTDVSRLYRYYSRHPTYFRSYPAQV